MSNTHKQIIKAVSVIVLTAILALSFSVVAFAADSLKGSNLRDDLWNTGGGTQGVTTTEVLSFEALLVYARDGVFGQECKNYVNSVQPQNYDELTRDGACTKAGDFYEESKRYAEIVDRRISRFDPDGKRMDAAMERISDLMQVVFSILLGFGFLVSLLVFIVLFIRLSWLPSHQIQKRTFYVDALTAGVSTILLGNLWIVLSLFQSSFSRFWYTFAVYSKDWRAVANMILSEFQGFITGLSGLAVLIVLLMFIVNFALLAFNGSNIQKRSERINSLVMCGVSAVGLSCLTFICGFFWNVLG